MMTKDICSTTCRRACNGATRLELPTNITGIVGTTFFVLSRSTLQNEIEKYTNNDKKPNETGGL